MASHQVVSGGVKLHELKASNTAIWVTIEGTYNGGERQLDPCGGVILCLS